jgi:diguanylate cyclase (GGDEF)-like protein/PAS domain S-box-containing protein
MLDCLVGDALGPRLVQVPVTATVGEAFGVMRGAASSWVLVRHADMPLGLVTQRSLIRLAAKAGNGFRDRPVSEAVVFPPVTVRADQPAREAFGLAIAQDVRHLAVLGTDNTVIGVVTQEDLAPLLGFEYFLEFVPVSAVMSVVVYAVPPETSAAEVLSILAGKPVCCVLAVRGRKPVGLLTEDGCARLLAAGRDLQATSLEEVMSSPVIRVRAGTMLPRAVALMRKRGIRRLVVVDDQGQARGLLTTAGIVKSLGGRCLESMEAAVRRLADKGDQTEVRVRKRYLEHILHTAIDMGIVATDAEFRITYANEAARQILGPQLDGALGLDARTFHARGRIKAAAFYKCLAEVRASGSHSFKLQLGEDDKRRIVSARVVALKDDGALVGYVLTLRDITVRVRTEEIIRRMAFHDMLTGLPNRYLFMERLDRELARTRRKKKGFSILVLDLDGFKQVNDRLGHPAGDKLLCAVAERLRAALREGDTVARMGGDEFTFLAPEADSAAAAERVAGKILATLAAPFVIDGQPLTIGGSLGVAVAPDHGSDAETLLKQADDAMYEAKAAGSVKPGPTTRFRLARGLPERPAGHRG